MALPDYESLMLPLLRLSADGSIHKFSDVVDSLADELSLTNEERIRKRLPVLAYQYKLITNESGTVLPSIGIKIDF